MRRVPNRFLAPLMSLALTLGGCASWGGVTETVDDQIKRESYQHGSLLGTDGGFNLFGPNKKRDVDPNGIGVNSFLWRASLDTVSFMPVVSADPFGGVIITDWYAPPDTPGERFKVNVYILDRQLRADGVRAAVFRQNRVGNDWRDVAVGSDTAAQLEDAILTRARQLRVGQLATPN